jgi:hypothetical protein
LPVVGEKPLLPRIGRSLAALALSDVPPATAAVVAAAPIFRNLRRSNMFIPP